MEVPVRKISFEWEGIPFDMNSGLNKQQFTTEAKKIEPGLRNEDIDEIWETYQTLQSGNAGAISTNQIQSAQPVNVGGTAPISPLGAVLSSASGNAVSGPAPVEQNERSQPAQETFTIPSVTELLKWVEAQKGVDERKKIEQSMKSDNRVDIPLSAAYSEYMRKTQGWTLKQIRERNAELTDKIRQAKVAYTLPHKNLASILNFNDKHVEKEDYQEALKIVKEMLGDLVIKELDVISQEFDEAREANLYVYGMFTEPAIYIYKQLVEGTEKIFAGGLYHEAFHRVSLFYFSERDRKRMYEKAREQYPELKDRSDAYVEEWLAEEFAARVLQWKKQGVPQNKYSDNFILRSFQKLFNLIKKVVERFKTNHLSDDIDLNELFRKMYAGRYAYARATKNNKELFRKLYEGRVAFGGVLVNNSVVADNALQFAEIKRDLLARLINNLGLAQLAEGGVFADVDLVKAELIKEVAAEERTAATIEQFIDDPSKLPESLRNRDIM